MKIFDLMASFSNNEAIIYKSVSGVIYKTYKEFLDDINAVKVSGKYKLIYGASKYENIVMQLACLLNGVVFCNLPQDPTQEYIDSITNKLDNAIIPNGTTHIVASSGTTGPPKLIALNFDKMLLTVDKQADLLGVNKDSIVSCFLSLSFDASLSDLYIAITRGATVFLTDTKLKSIRGIQSEIKKYRITHTDLPPSYLKFINFKDTFIQALVFGGEIADKYEVQNIRKHGIKCFNSYGPTENSISAFMCLVTDNWESNDIGSPLFSNSHKIIDNVLYLSSGLFLGYINDDELTKNKTINLDGIDYFNTGDKVEHKNGSMFYHGRIDRQFKRNGVLIIPEELESVARNIGCTYAIVTNTSPYTLIYTANIDRQDLLTEIKKYIPSSKLPTLLLQKELGLSVNGKTKLQ